MRPVASLTTYFRGVYAEARKVVWPSWPLLLRYFVSVVVGVALATAFIGGLDYVFLKVLSTVLTK
jgi:preprotein translocase SecE subunit